MRSRINAHPHQHRVLARAAPLFAVTPAPEVGIIDLDQARQLVLGVARGQYCVDLFQHQPRGGVGHVYDPRQRHRTDPPFVLGYQEDCPEPIRERQFGLVKDGAGRDGHVMAALSALVEGQALPRIAPLARTVDGLRLVVPPAWAPKPVGPPLPQQIGLAL